MTSENEKLIAVLTSRLDEITKRLDKIDAKLETLSASEIPDMKVDLAIAQNNHKHVSAVAGAIAGFVASVLLALINTVLR